MVDDRGRKAVVREAVSSNGRWVSLPCCWTTSRVGRRTCPGTRESRRRSCLLRLPFLDGSPSGRERSIAAIDWGLTGDRVRCVAGGRTAGFAQPRQDHSCLKAPMMDKRRHATAGVSCPPHVTGPGRIASGDSTYLSLTCKKITQGYRSRLQERSRGRCLRSGCVGPCRYDRRRRQEGVSGRQWLR